MVTKALEHRLILFAAIVVMAGLFAVWFIQSDAVAQEPPEVVGSDGPAAPVPTEVSPATILSPTSIDIVPGSPTNVTNCIPFGGNVGFGFTGFIYRDVPGFNLAVGDTFGFDMGALNGVDTRRNIYFAAANINPAPAVVVSSNVVSQGVAAVAWTQVASDTQIPLSPKGNGIKGDYELRYVSDAAFSFPGGGLIVGFGASPPGAYADTGCEQVLVATVSGDASGNFYSRFFLEADQTLAVLDDTTSGGTAVALGGIVIDATGDPVLKAIAKLEGKADTLEQKVDRLETKLDTPHPQHQPHPAFPDHPQHPAFPPHPAFPDHPDQPNLAPLEVKADRLEGKADKLEGKVDALRGLQDAHDAALGGHAEANAAAQAKLEGKADALEAKADALRSLQDTHDAALGGHAEANTAAQAKLEGKADRLEAKADNHAQQADTISNATLEAIRDAEERTRQINSFEVFELKEKRRWLLVLAESGKRVDATLTKIQVARDHKKNNPLSWVDVTAKATVTVTDTGLLDVSLDKDKKDKDVDKADLFLFEVTHDHGTFAHFGITVIDRRDHKP